MTVRPEISTLLDEIEHSVARKFVHRHDIEALLELTEQHGQQQLRDDILFFAKFLSNAYQVLSRGGAAAEETEPLSREFAATVEKESSLIRTAVKEGPADIKARFVEAYFSMSQSALSNLLSLCRELAWVKNYAIDRKGLF